MYRLFKNFKKKRLLTRARPYFGLFGLTKNIYHCTLKRTVYHYTHLDDKDRKRYEEQGYTLKNNEMTTDPTLLAITNSFHTIAVIIMNRIGLCKLVPSGPTFLKGSDLIEGRVIHTFDHNQIVEAMDFNAQSTKLGVRLRNKFTGQKEIKLFSLVPNEDKKIRFLRQYFKERPVCKRLPCLQPD